MDDIVQPLIETEINELDEIIKAAYHILNSRKKSLRLYLQIQPENALAIKRQGKVVGFGAAMNYGPFAYIGLISVHPQVQRQGIGRTIVQQLLNRLEVEKCETILLDASTEGASLYPRFGFVKEDSTCIMCRQQHIDEPDRFPEQIALLSRAELSEVIEYDIPAFGAQRAELLTALWEEYPARCLIARDAAGQITGYLIAQSDCLGPWIASTIEDAEKLLQAGLSLPFQNEPKVFVSAKNNAANTLLTRYNFSQQRTLIHMCKGPAIPRQRQTAIYGQTSLGLG